jgi:hypothetical protein
MQSKWDSGIEVCLNTITRYIVSVILQITINPYFGIHISYSVNLLYVLLFTIVSVIRSYLWRRYFNYRTIKKYFIERNRNGQE